MGHPVSPFIINKVKKVYQVYINTLDKEPGSVLQQENQTTFLISFYILLVFSLNWQLSLCPKLWFSSS